MKKILILSDGVFPYVMGGMQKHTYFLTKYALKSGFIVKLVHCVSNNAYKEEELRQLFDPKSNDRLQILNIPLADKGKLPGHYVRFSKRFSLEVYNAVKDELNAYDYIYIQGFSGWTLLDNLSSLTTKAKVILNFHGLEMFQLQPDLKSRLASAMLRKPVKHNLRKSPFVHSLGGALDRILLDQIGLHKKQIISVPIGLDPEWVTDDNDKKKSSEILNFVFIGRNEKRKGYSELIEVLCELQSQYAFTLHTIGSFGPAKHSFQKNHGVLRKEEDIKRVLDQCEVLLCPSYAEGMPTVILEGMARKCAIIATNTGAVCEQVDKGNGWLIEPANKEQLRMSLVEALTSPKNVLETKMNASIDRIKEKFLWPDIIPKLFN